MSGGIDDIDRGCIAFDHVWCDVVQAWVVSPSCCVPFLRELHLYTRLLGLKKRTDDIYFDFGQCM